MVALYANIGEEGHADDGAGLVLPTTLTLTKEKGQLVRDCSRAKQALYAIDVLLQEPPNFLSGFRLSHNRGQNAFNVCEAAVMISAALRTGGFFADATWTPEDGYDCVAGEDRWYRNGVTHRSTTDRLFERQTQQQVHTYKEQVLQSIRKRVVEAWRKNNRSAQ